MGVGGELFVGGGEGVEGEEGTRSGRTRDDVSHERWCDGSGGDGSGSGDGENGEDCRSHYMFASNYQTKHDAFSFAYNTTQSIGGAEFHDETFISFPLDQLSQMRTK